MTIKIDRLNGLYVARCTYEERLILKRAGFKFNGTRWVTENDDTARKFYDNCIGAAKERLDNLDEIKRQLVEASFADDYDGHLLAPDGLTYLPFQRAGIAFALERPDTLIADSPGLGKTVQALGVINNLINVKNVLLVVPASLKINWAKEARKWVRSELGLTIGTAHTKPKIIIDAEGTKKSTTEYIWPDENIVIINYDMLEQFHDEVRSRKWDVLVCDEAHVLKNKEARKTKQVIGYEGKRRKDKISAIEAIKRIFLTGTPILNKPLDMFCVISAFGFENVFGNYVKFIKKFCAAFETPWGHWDTTGTDNLEEFQELLRSTFMIRRHKNDVLKELPPKRRQIITLPQDGLSRIVKKEKQIFSDNLKNLMILNGEKTEADYEEMTDAQLRQLIDNIHERTKNFDDVEDFDNYEATHFEAIANAREEIGLAKLPMMIEYIRSLLESGEKVVVLVVHRTVAHRIADAFEGSVKFIGGMSDKEKNASVERFQNDPDCRVFVGNINAAGVGITLTEAWNLVMGELCFVPALLEQGEDRIHRIGQTAHALIHYLIVSGSLEERLMEIVLEKLEMIHAALDRKK
jgi:SNF2 family DNA or RNA helicase